jgi:hypothetical protein
MEPSAAAFLLVTRANGAGASPSDAASWLHRALVLQHRNRELLAAAYELGRRHRSTDPVSFDRNWTLNAGGSIPDCLTVKPSLLSTARAWIGTDTYSAERDYLSAHPELLDPAADLAVAEALLGVSEQEANRYNALRETAQRDGTEAAYRPCCSISWSMNSRCQVMLTSVPCWRTDVKSYLQTQSLAPFPSGLSGMTILSARLYAQQLYWTEPGQETTSLFDAIANRTGPHHRH